MDYPQMVYNGKLTEAGQEVVNYIEELIQGTGKTSDGLNQQPGHIKHYFNYVHGLKTMSAVEFVEQFGQSSIKNAWHDMVYLREQVAQTQKVDVTADKVSSMEESLNQLREELMGEVAQLKKENSTLKGQLTKLRKLREQDDVEDDAGDDKPEDDETPADDGEGDGEGDK